MNSALFNMIEQQIRPWYVHSSALLQCIAQTPREDYVPAAYRELAFADIEIPLAVSATGVPTQMTSPKVIARTLEAADLKISDDVIEIGTGSGYQTALAAQLARRVLTLEIDPMLADAAALRLKRFTNVTVQQADGSSYLHRSGFDIMLLNGTMSVVPAALLQLMKPTGRVFAVLGRAPIFSLSVLTQQAGQWHVRALFETSLAPLVNFPQASRFEF